MKKIIMIVLGVVVTMQEVYQKIIQFALIVLTLGQNKIIWILIFQINKNYNIITKKIIKKFISSNLSNHNDHAN
jgi:hypothetical protein